MIEISPQIENEFGAARCFMFYDFDAAFSSSFLDMSESVFVEFGAQPTFAIGVFEEKKSKGDYRRVRKRIGDLLDSSGVDVKPVVRIDSTLSDEEGIIFPCDVRIAFSETSYGLKIGVVTVKERLVDSLEEFTNRVANLVFEQIGEAYAHAFNFPAVYGPDYYLESIGVVPSGGSILENQSYRDRITRFRDHTWHRGLRPSQGYLREVYSINFLLRSHLQREFNGRAFSDYAEEVGDLLRIPNAKEFYRWEIAESELPSVRRDLEKSGLVLSAKILD